MADFNRWIKDSQGHWVKVSISEKHLAYMVGRAENSTSGKSRGGPCEVRLTRPRVAYRVSYPGRAWTEGLPARAAAEVVVRSFSAEAARDTGAAKLRARVWDCVVEEVE